MWLQIWILFLACSFPVNIHSLESLSNSDSSQPCSANSKENDVLHCGAKPKRYILFKVNPGEGFNLIRDVFVRISPLVNKLNAEDETNQWILVLPPWGNLPHWRSRVFFPWKTFFQFDKIQEYVPAIEFLDFLEECGMDNNLDIVYQLQHFPFDENTAEWREKIETDIPCEQELKYKLNKKTGLLSANIWKWEIFTKEAKCMALRGQASTLLGFLLGSSYKSILLDRAEIIIWDSYGDREWWRARKSLQFSEKLFMIAREYLDQQNLGSSGKSGDKKYIAVHLRRRDFLSGRAKEMPSIKGTATQIFNKMKTLKTFVVFIATDSSDDDVKTLKSELNVLTHNEYPHKTLSLLYFKNKNLTEGEVAIVDQIICSLSTYFIGTAESTFTTRIFEERQIYGADEEYTFNYLCPDDTNVPCKTPTRWKVQN